MDIFPPTPTTLQACDAFLWAFNFTPLLSLYIILAQIQTMIAVRVCTSAVSLHSALNEPIMGVYVALMRVSVRRETLHRSPPNQWGLACYTTPRFSAFTRPPSLHPFLLSPHRFLSLSLSLFLLCSISKRQEWGIRSIGHEERFKQNKMRPSQQLEEFGVLSPEIFQVSQKKKTLVNQ